MILRYTVTNDKARKEYGIALYNEKVKLKEIPAITQSREDITALARLLNDLKIEPCHFEDVVEDYLTDFTV